MYYETISTIQDACIINRDRPIIQRLLPAIPQDILNNGKLTSDNIWEVILPKTKELIDLYDVFQAYFPLDETVDTDYKLVICYNYEKDTISYFLTCTNETVNISALMHCASFDSRVMTAVSKTVKPKQIDKKLINGKAIAADIKTECKEAADKLKAAGTRPCLAIVQVGNNTASNSYITGKKKDCEEIGIKCLHYVHPTDISETELIQLIQELNHDNSVHGIIVQLPLPPHINEHTIATAISPEKDVDGFHPINMGKLAAGEDCFVCCTPYGIMEMLERSDIPIEGKNCVVVGRSNIVGKPTAMLLTQENATVTLTHSKTQNLADITSQADILIVATGKSHMITADYVKNGAVVIDVGIHRQANGKLCGDVHFSSVYHKASRITPVPGGVGPMTRAMLMRNCITAATHAHQRTLSKCTQTTMNTVDKDMKHENPNYHTDIS